MACAEKYKRTVMPQEQHPGKAAPMSRSNGRPQVARQQVGRPTTWWPRAGWGTVRGFGIQDRGNGRVNLSFYFVPDDGSQPELIEIMDTIVSKEIGEYARGIKRGDDFTIKVSAETMAKAARTFQEINQMELSKRKIMFADRTDVDGDAGWTWTPDYTLVPVAPGLLSLSSPAHREVTAANLECPVAQVPEQPRVQHQSAATAATRCVLERPAVTV